MAKLGEILPTTSPLAFIQRLSTRASNSPRSGCLSTTSCSPVTGMLCTKLKHYSRLRSDPRSRFYNAHETSAVEPFALALACGDADFKVSHFSAAMFDSFTDPINDRCIQE